MFNSHWTMIFLELPDLNIPHNFNIIETSQMRTKRLI